MAPDLLGVCVPIYALSYLAEVMHPAAGVDDRPKDTIIFVVAFVFIAVIFVTEDVFVAIVVPIGVVIVRAAVAAVTMGATGRLGGGPVRESPGGFGKGRSGVTFLMHLPVTERRRTRS